MDFANLNEMLPKRICIWLVALIIIFSALSYADRSLMWDENAYLGNARDVLSGSAYSEGFRFPLLGYILAAVWAVTGESVIVAKAAMIFFTLANAFVFYLICRRYFKEDMSLLLTVMMSVSSEFLFWGFRVYADVMSVFFTLLAFYFLLDRKRPLAGPALAGVFMSLSFLSRFSAAVFMVVFLAYLLWERKPKAAALFVIGALVAASPWLVANYQWHGDPLHNLSAQMEVISAYTQPEPLENQAFNFLHAMHALTLLVPVGIYSMYRRRPDGWLLIFLLLAAFFVYFTFFVNLKLLRYYLMAIPFLVLLVGEGIEWSGKRHKRRKLVAALALIAVLAGAAFAGFAVAERGACSNDGAVERSVDFVCQRVSPGDTVISNFWPYFGYSCNVTAVSNWAEPETLLQHYEPRYLVYHEWFGLDFEQEGLESSLELEETITGACGEKAFIYTPRE